MTDAPTDDGIPKDDLRELVEEWRSVPKSYFDDQGKGYHRAVNRCADELEQVLEDE